MKSRSLLVVAVTLTLTLACTACGGGGGASGSGAAKARGPISIWYSNNAQEVAWGKQVVAAWNAGHPTEKVTAQEIPTGKSSEEVIGAAITAGSEPCLIYNTSPAAVPTFQQQGGLVLAQRLRRTAPATSRRAPDPAPASTNRRTASTTSCRGSRTRS